MKKLLSITILFISISFNCIFASESALKEFIENLNANQKIELSNSEKADIKDYIRRNPKTAIRLIDQVKISKISSRSKTFIYDLLTTANYNIGYIEKASLYNDSLLKNLNNYSYNLTDSLKAFSNKMILFYSLNQPVDALKSAVNLHKRIRSFEIDNSTLLLYQQLGVLYSLLEFNEESKEVLEIGIEEAEKQNLDRRLMQLQLVLAYQHNKDSNYDEALNLLKNVEKNIDIVPQLARRIYTGLASSYKAIGDTLKSSENYKKAIHEFFKYPDILTLSSVTAEYATFCYENPYFNNDNTLNEAYNYLKDFDYIDLPEFKVNLYTLELMKAIIENKIDAELQTLLFQRDKLKNQIQKTKNDFILENLDYHYKDEIHKETMAKLSAENKQARTKNKYLVIISIISSIFVVCISIIFFYYFKNQREKLKLKEDKLSLSQQKLINEQSLLNKLREEQEREKERHQRSLKQLEKHKAILNRLDHILSDLKEYKGDELVKELKGFKLDFGEYLSGLYQDEVIDNFKIFNEKKFETFKSVIGNEKSSEFLLAVLLIQGFNTKEISTSLGKSEKAVRSTRYRLRKLLEINKETDLINFLKQL